MSTYRDNCGTAGGAVAHQQAGERLCGWCLEAEAMARLRAEAVPRRPPAVRATAAEAAAHRAMLDAETAEYERDHPGETTHRRLRLVREPGAFPRRAS